jgi:uncharacterized protein (TIGR00730 family)
VTDAAIKNLAVFCGANVGNHPRFAQLARALGASLARRDIGLVYGGGNVGLMGVIADAVIEGRGRVIGVIPKLLAEAELAHAGATEMHIVESMHDRKALMTARCDAFVALPGGLGTMDELFEALTWAQLAIHGKRVFVLDPFGFYAPLVAQVDHFVATGFVSEKNRGLLRVANSLGGFLAAIDPPRGGETIYHLTSRAAWLAALDASEYRGDSLATEGFIHASTHAQLAPVANRLFRGRDDLVLLHLDLDRIAPRVVRENLEGGTEKFPHLYGPLNLDAVLAATDYRAAADGRFLPPPGSPQ